MSNGTDQGSTVKAKTTWRTRSRARAAGVVAALAVAPAVMLFGMPTASATPVARGDLAVIAGDGSAGAPTTGPATSSALDNPVGMAVDLFGNVYIGDMGNNVVEKVTPSGHLSIVAGNGTMGAPVPGPATSSPLDGPHGVAVDAFGNLYIADTYTSQILKVTPGGTLSIIAGSGASGAPVPGPATSSPLQGPVGVAVGLFGTVYIADTYYIEKVTPGGTLSIIAGDGSYGPPTPGPATSSGFEFPSSVAVDLFGNVYIGDVGNSLVEKVTPAGTLSVFAGDGGHGAPTPGPATSSATYAPLGLAVDLFGDVYISASNDVEMVNPAGILSIVAGNGAVGPPTPGPATSSDLYNPVGLAVDLFRNVFIADEFNNVVEEVGGPLSPIECHFAVKL
jgi:NHL repeat